jgi:hypothetical protein
VIQSLIRRYTPPTAATGSGGNEQSVMSEELGAVRAELLRVDGKCEALTGLAGAGATYLATQVHAKEPLAVWLPMALAGTALGIAAVVLLVFVIRPRFGAEGFCRYAQMTADSAAKLFTNGAAATKTVEFRAGALVTYSKLTLRKYVAYRLAVDLTTFAALAIAAGTIAKGLV